MFCRLTEKIFGLTHIWKGKKDLGNSMNKTNFFLCVRQDHGKISLNLFVLQKT